MKRKRNKKYYFSVEGQTEKWYLDRLQFLINNEPTSVHNVSFFCKVEKNPLKFVKSVTNIDKIEITHLLDLESTEVKHIKNFEGSLDLMKKASSLGKQIKYQLGYCNFTFELWLILHKIDCFTFFEHRKGYLKPLNRAYGENFSSIDEWKEEKNFKRILNQIHLDDVRQAIKRGKMIMQFNTKNNYRMVNYKGYKYYLENPSLTIWESIEKIMKDCDLIKEGK